MRGRTVVLSLLFHAGLAASLLGAASHRQGRRPIAVALSETKKKDKERPKPPKPPPIRPAAHPPVEHKVAALPKAEAVTPAPSPTTRAATATALTMTNDDGPGGIALPSRPAAAAPTRVASAVTESRRQRMRDALGPGSGDQAPCGEEPTKPEPVFKQEIEYTAQARAEGVEGKLKLRLTIGADGAVVRVDILESVSAELDAAAVAASKQWRFKPAMACGRAVAGGTYVLARRFELGD